MNANRLGLEVYHCQPLQAPGNSVRSSGCVGLALAADVGGLYAVAAAEAAEGAHVYVEGAGSVLIVLVHPGDALHLLSGDAFVHW